MALHSLGFDVGLSGVRATVLREDGALVASARRAHEHARFGPGLAEHDPADWLAGIEAAGREVLRQAAAVEVGCVGLAALGPAPVLVDDELRPLTKAPLFGLDRRAEPERRALLGAGATLGAVLPNLGSAPDDTLDNALPKLLHWAEREPELTARAAWALDATGFLVASLTGVPVMDNVTAGDYALAGVESPVPLPEPLDPVAVAGELSAEAGARLGLTAGIPVAAGTYDSFVDIAAAGVRRPGDAGLVLGSTMIICRAAEPHAPTPAGLGASGYPGDGVLIGGWTLSGGLGLDWFAERFATGMTQAELAGAAARVEPGGVLALPYLAGERTPIWDPHARGAFANLAPDSGPAELYRALVDSLALVALDHAERLDGALGPCEAWRVTGGGTRNHAWLGATADALGVPLEIAPDAAEATGPALLALRAIGIDPERPSGRRIEPDRRRTARYATLLPIFRELHPRLSEALRDLNATSEETET